MAEHPLGNLGAPGVHDLWNSFSEDIAFEDEFRRAGNVGELCIKSLFAHLEVVMDRLMDMDIAEEESPPDVLDAVYNSRRLEHLERLVRLTLDEAMKKVIAEKRKSGVYSSEI